MSPKPSKRKRKKSGHSKRKKGKRKGAPTHTSSATRKSTTIHSNPTVKVTSLKPLPPKTSKHQNNAARRQPSRKATSKMLTGVDRLHTLKYSPLNSYLTKAEKKAAGKATSRAQEENYRNISQLRPLNSQRPTKTSEAIMRPTSAAKTRTTHLTSRKPTYKPLATASRSQNPRRLSENSNKERENSTKHSPDKIRIVVQMKNASHKTSSENGSRKTAKISVTGPVTKLSLNGTISRISPEKIISSTSVTNSAIPTSPKSRNVNKATQKAPKPITPLTVKVSSQKEITMQRNHTRLPGRHTKPSLESVMNGNQTKNSKTSEHLVAMNAAEKSTSLVLEGKTVSEPKAVSKKYLNGSRVSHIAKKLQVKEKTSAGPQAVDNGSGLSQIEKKTQIKTLWNDPVLRTNLTNMKILVSQVRTDEQFLDNKNAISTCRDSVARYDVSLPAAATTSGNITKLGLVPDMRRCIDLSCESDGDVAYMLGSLCFVIYCHTPSICEPRPLSTPTSGVAPVVAFLRRNNTTQNGKGMSIDTL